MHSVWVNYGHPGDERDRFADLAATLAWPSAPAGPPNRLRAVRVIRDGERAWYVKTFQRTQWKNRLRFRLTAPRARDDADRELRVTAALRAAGVAAPRPVAYGRSGEASYYVCAELPGASFAEAWRQAPSRPLAMAVAAFCGELLGRGFWLPDLAPDHVFVEAAADGYRCAVLDLHNGRVARAGAPPRRLLRRVLRRFAGAARGTTVAQGLAHRFALVLLRAAGRGDDARAVLRALPPIATARRYERAGKSRDYAERTPARAGREAALLRAVWPGRAGERVLDLPCGAGRLLPLLRDEFGHRVVQGDGAMRMLAEARGAARAAPHAVQADALQLPFADRAVDGVVAFRFLHHLPPELSSRAIAEACRVARRFVVASFFHPCSFHHLTRTLRRCLGGARTRFSRPLGAVRADFARHGFRLHRRAADLPFARDLWVASFVRDGAGDTAGSTS